ncbi:hypothetical protein KGF56_002981 [Candida oxycetoniae]|uniref:Formate/nitrite transporter n=1 Tax=Candida oxycetoniae TaxID=497107 RepID=A0AAI9SX80_9ASCO|nr:uncharacterized protein KGF56_002981 [Candida oxycetoniae]KAI3404220.2 hypothetical protein KGF56_002981 [Candida oxycetoniae]
MASRDIVTSKASFSFVQTLLKAMAGNFYVCMAIYLQIMVKPLHVKFLMMLLPVFSFVSLGFTHSVADMTVLIIGKINGAPIPMKELVWKVFLPGALGNMIGGSFFGIVICWYLHLYVVERDKKELNLPEYEFRDEQPELNQDSRVVRQKKPIYDEDVVLNETDPEEQYVDEQPELNQDSRVVRRRKRRPHFNGNYVDDVDNEQLLEEKENVSPPESSLSSENGGEQYNPVPLLDKVTTNLSKIKTRNTINSMSSSKSARSPKGLFPVYGMGPPLARERSIADGTNIIYNTNKDNGNDGDAVGDNDDDDNDDDDDDGVNSAEYIGTKLKKMVTNRSFRSRRASDLESEPVRTKSLSGISRIMSNRPTKTTFVQPIDPPTLIKPKDSKNANDDELDIADLEPTTK